MRGRLLLTGFTSFGGEGFNPSGWAVRHVEEIPGVELIRAVLRTSYRDSERELRKLLRRHRPHAVVAFGLSARRTKISVEAVALNVDHAEERDNTRERRLCRKIDPRGPWIVESRLPVDRILRALRRERVPCSLSYQAGTYVCNHVHYVLLRSTRVPAGFIHLPRRRGRWVLHVVRTIVREVVESISS